jgi:aminopeptidase
VPDPRIEKLADVIVRYSTGVKKDQLVRLTGDPVALPLMEAIYERCVQAGAHVQFKCVPDSLSTVFFEHAKPHQLDYVSPLSKQEVKTIDVSIGIWAETNTKAMSNVDPKKQARASAARKPVFKTFMKRAADGDLKWCGTLFPTNASAQDAEMSLREYEDFVFRAGLLHKRDPVAEWKKVAKQQQKVVDYLTGKKEIRFVTKAGTDLLVNVDGMTWINCCGNENFPDGEVFTGPNLKAKDGGVNGIVRYSFPAVHHGREVHDIELTFEKGRVVNASASKNQAFLEKMLDMDRGARSLGEIAIGTNYAIQQYTKNTLFDEKIGGTFHAAVGAGYPESGNANESGLHWDMVCDMRPRKGDKTSGGEIIVDGKTIQKDGKFVFKGWPGT